MPRTRAKKQTRRTTDQIHEQLRICWRYALDSIYQDDAMDQYADFPLLFARFLERAKAQRISDVQIKGYLGPELGGYLDYLQWRKAQSQPCATARFPPQKRGLTRSSKQRRRGI